MVTQERRTKTKKEIRECQLERAFNDLSAAFFPSKEARLEEEILENDTALERWFWEGGSWFSMRK